MIIIVKLIPNYNDCLVMINNCYLRHKIIVFQNYRIVMLILRPIHQKEICNGYFNYL